MECVESTMPLISQSSRRTATITGVINVIAFQTNLLALNFAVEAERAGEHVRSVAVVATELLSLVGGAMLADMEMKGLIDQYASNVDYRVRLALDAGKTIKELVSQMQRANDLIAEISLASKGLTQVVALIADAVAQLDLMTHQNAAMSEQNIASTNSLRDQANHLANVVKVFSV